MLESSSEHPESILPERFHRKPTLTTRKALYMPYNGMGDFLPYPFCIEEIRTLLQLQFLLKQMSAPEWESFYSLGCLLLPVRVFLSGAAWWE